MDKSSTSGKHIPQLDGLRGLAVILVLFTHSAEVFIRIHWLNAIDHYGLLGVQLFFVLSGYLITGILLDTKEKPGYFKNFLARRGLRIYPLYYAVLAFVVLSGFINRHGVNWWTYLLYISNLVYPGGVQPAPLGPVWSLAVEEQFYLVWPIIVWVLQRESLRRFSVGLVVLVGIARFILPLPAQNTLFQLDALAAGAFVACLKGNLQPLRRPAKLLVWLLPFGLTLPNLLYDKFSQAFQVFGSVSLLILVLQNNSALAGFFRVSALRYIGKISYSVYLLHSFVFAAFLRMQLAKRVIDGGSSLNTVLCLAAEYAVVLVVASASYYMYERPFLRLKKFFDTNSTLSTPRAAYDLPGDGLGSTAIS